MLLKCKGVQRLETLDFGPDKYVQSLVPQGLPLLPRHLHPGQVCAAFAKTLCSKRRMYDLAK